MPTSVNKVILIGNLGKDPEIRNTQDNQKIVILSVATSESWKDKATGMKKQHTEWHRVIIFNDMLANVATTYLKKGAKVYVEGQINTKKWTDDHAVEHTSTDIVVPKYHGELILLNKENSSHVGGTSLPLTYKKQEKTLDDLEDEIPF